MKSRAIYLTAKVLFHTDALILMVVAGVGILVGVLRRTI